MRRLALLLLFAPGAAFAQPARTCATPTPTIIDRMVAAEQVRQFKAQRSEGVQEAHPVGEAAQSSHTIVPVAVHVVSSGPGLADGNVPDDRIDAQIDVLNEAFDPHGFQFVLAAVSRTVNRAWANGLSDGTPAERAMKDALAQDPARFLNLFLVDAAGDLLGWASLPYSGSETDRQGGVVLDRETLPGGAFAPFNEGDTGTHEVGHWLGLYHTFNEDAPPGDPCGGDGDEVADTPVEASPASGCPTGRDTCPALPGLDPITNYMDYTTDACMVEFTSGQADRMQALTAAFRPTIAAGVAPLASPGALAFGEVFVETVSRQAVRVVNTTDAPLGVSSVTSTSAAFEPSATSFTVPAGASVAVEVAFEPDAATDYTAMLTLTSSAATFTIDLNGRGRLRPDLEIVTPAASRALAVGASDTAVLTFVNGGPGALDYQFVGQETGRRTARRGEGGPDAFGYTWQDSDEPGGPVYEWVERPSTATGYAPEDDGALEVELPFDVPFYGETYDRLWISANGFLSFGEAPGDQSFRNLPLPDADAPAIVAPYWDDFDPPSGGSLWSADLGNGRFAVTWQDIPHYTEGGDGGRFRFQVVLSADGTILFQYHTIEVGDYAASGTVGVQPDDASAGLGIAYNVLYARPELAVRVAPRAGWVASVSPTTGTLAAGDEQLVTVQLDASGLAPGAYQDLLLLQTNDPLRPESRFHVVLAVEGALAPPALAAPGYDRADVPAFVRLDWLDAEGASEYEVQVARDGAFEDLVLSQIVTASEVPFSGETETAYLWRVRSVEGGERSAWSLPFPFATGTDPGDPTPVPLDFVVDAPFPNPTSGVVRVPFTLAEDAEVRADVFDTTGRRVLEVQSRVDYRAGVQNALRLNVGALAPGVYLIRLTAGAKSATRRLVVVR